MKKMFIVGIMLIISFTCFSQTTPSISASASPQTICQGDSVVLSATGGLTYEWSHGLGNGQSVTAHPTTTTIYTVTATDANGCTATASVSVNVLTAPPTASYSINPSDCFKIGQPIDFVATDPNADSWFWSFYQVAFATSQQTTQTFSDYGFQCVYLIVSNACGSDTAYQYIYVTDSLCHCDTITWHIDGLVVTNDTLLEGPQNVKGDIFVQNGVTLTMSGNFYFHPESRIVVEEYATLILGEIAFLDKVPGCEMWQGIEVWGNTDQPSTDPVQGKVILGSAHIHNAHVAILLGKRNMEFLCKVHNKLYDLEKSGGVVISYQMGAPQRQFFKNGCGIRYIIKNNREASANQLRSIYFACQSPLHNYHYNSAVPYHYPNHLNPWAGNANPLQRTWKAIAFDNLENIQVRSNYFMQLEYGVHAINSKSYLLNSTFIDVSFGFYALHTQQSMQNKHMIAFNEFDLINKQQSGEGKGIYILNGKNDYIHSNIFRNTPHDTVSCETAIQLDFTSNYRVNENVINYYKRGIVANWNISGFIGAQAPLWDGNIFNSCLIAFESNFANNYVKNKCNTHTPNNTNPGHYYMNWKNTGLYMFWPPWLVINLSLGDQGIATNPQHPLAHKRPAGNRFSISSKKHLETNIHYRYFHHFNNDPANNEFQPVKHHWTTPLTISATGAQFPSPAQSCSPMFVIDTTSVVINEINQLQQNITSKSLEYADVMNALDKGQTYTLISAIENGMAAGRLQNLLISHSPLSDQVISTLMTEAALPHGNFKNVMEKNLPVSDILVPQFFDYVAAMPPGIRDQLLQLHTLGSSEVTPASVLRELNQLVTEYEHMMTEVGALLIDNNKQSVLIQLLEQENSVKALQILFGTYLHEKDYVQAQQKLIQLNAVNQPFVQDFVVAGQQLLNLNMEGKNIYELDSATLQSMWQLALQCPPSPAVYTARAVVEIITGEHISECPLDMQPRTMSHTQQQVSEFVLGDIYPNPASDYVMIPYTTPEEGVFLLSITDITGKHIETIELPGGKHEYKLSVAHYAQGMYFCTLWANGTQIARTKMNIIR